MNTFIKKHGFELVLLGGFLGTLTTISISHHRHGKAMEKIWDDHLKKSRKGEQNE